MDRDGTGSKPLASAKSPHAKFEPAPASADRDLVDLRRLFDLSLDLMVICDTQGRFRTVSSSATKILGYTPEELVGRRFMEFVHPDDIERTHAAHEALIRGSDVVEFENRYVRRDGAIIDLSWSAAWYADAAV